MFTIKRKNWQNLWNQCNLEEAIETGKPVKKHQNIQLNTTIQSYSSFFSFFLFPKHLIHTHFKKNHPTKSCITDTIDNATSPPHWYTTNNRLNKTNNYTLTQNQNIAIRTWEFWKKYEERWDFYEWLPMREASRRCLARRIWSVGLTSASWIQRLWIATTL